MTTYKINFKNVKKGYILPIVFLLIGIVFLIVFSIVSLNMLNKGQNMDGEVNAYNIEWIEDYDEDGVTYKPIYYYEVDGAKYTCSSNISSSSKNNKGIVYYDIKNPNNCLTDFEKSGANLFLIFLIIPVIFIIIGLVILVKNIKKTNKIKKLVVSGILVKGLPYELVNSNVRINNRPIKAISLNYKFPDGCTRILTSLPLYNSNIIGVQSGLCDLLYDPSDYNNYYIDFEIGLTGVGTPHVEYYKIDENTFK